jgi:hypothetical protein
MNDPNVIELRFVQGDASASEIRKVLDEVVAELDSVESATVKEESQGFEPTTILIAIAGYVGMKLADSVWDDIVWPRIKQRLGSGALGAKK